MFWQGAAGSPFRLSAPMSAGIAAGGTTPGMSLKVGELATFDAASSGYQALHVSQPDPRSVQALSGGDSLVADAANHLVAEFSPSGALVWSYTTADDPGLSAPVSATSLSGASVASGADVLICDQGAGRVFVVAADHKLVWQYGTVGTSGSGVDQLDSPASAQWLANGNTSADITDDGNVAICDAGNHRVIVVRASDYSTASAGNGFSQASIIWRYGKPGAPGTGVDQLEAPVSVQQMTTGRSRGDLLICDRQAGRVLEVRHGDFEASQPDDGFTASSIVWRFPGSGTTSTLSSPSCALGSYGSDQTIWIADSGNGRILGVSTRSTRLVKGRLTVSQRPSRHAVFADYGPSPSAGFVGSLTAPASLSQAGNGSLVVADPGARRLVALGAKASSATVRSISLDCGLARRKRFDSITCSYSPLPFTDVSLSYSIDGGAPKLLGGFSCAPDSGAVTMLFPPATAGTKIVYYVTLSTASLAYAPELRSLAIAFTPLNAKPSGKGGGGLSGTHANSNGTAGTSSHSGGSGSGSGGGSGGGTGGGTGQGTSAGRGSGSGSATGSGSGTSSTSTGSSGPKLPAAVAASGADQSSLPRTVAGYALRPAGSAGGGQGGGSSVSSPAHLPLLQASAGFGLGLLLLAGTFSERSKRRMFATWDPRVARPFPAERTSAMPRGRYVPTVPRRLR